MRSAPLSLRAPQCATGARGSRYPVAARTAASCPRMELPVCPLQFPLAPTCMALATAGPVRGSGRSGAARTARRADDVISVPRARSCGDGGGSTTTDLPCVGASFGAVRSAPSARVWTSDVAKGPSRVSALSSALPFPLGGQCGAFRCLFHCHCVGDRARCTGSTCGSPASARHAHLSVAVNDSAYWGRRILGVVRGRGEGEGAGRRSWSGWKDSEQERTRQQERGGARRLRLQPGL